MVGFAQRSHFSVATWNVENLFDTAHDHGKQDEEFLPGSTRQWNSSRYWRKLKNITQTIAAMELPDIVALEEVENDTALRDLTRRTALWNAHYRYVMTNSPDQRGVDVALLYKPETFQLISWHPVRVPSSEHGLRPTRDILYVNGKTPQPREGGDSDSAVLHICVVHLPSRQNNNAATRGNRMLAVQTLRNVIDSIYNIEQRAHKTEKTHEARVEPRIIVLGDFNAEPGDEIFEKLTPPLMTLLPTDKKTLKGERGTYYFRGIWGYLDHILATQTMKSAAIGEAEECRFPFLLRTSKQFPWRTYGGTSYLGGISDHLPLRVTFLF